MSVLLTEQRGHALWLTLNRPEHKNLLNADLFVALSEAWDEARSNKDVRVVVLTASGDQDFCCGGDLGGVIPLWTGAREPASDVERKLLADPLIVDKVMLKQEPLYKPIIGAFNGRALGGGCELLQATDVRIAAEHAMFGLPEPKSGIAPGAGTMVRLTRQIPYAHAMKMLMTGEPIDARTALDYGLISEVLPKDRLLMRAEELADRIAANAPLALQGIKRTALETHTQHWDEAFQFEMQQNAEIMMSKDAREGPKAFKAKRKPEFKGE